MFVVGNNCLTIEWFKKGYFYLFLNKKMLVLKDEKLEKYAEYTHDKTTFIITQNEYALIKDSFHLDDDYIIISEEYNNTVGDELLLVLGLTVTASEYNCPIRIESLTSINNDTVDEVVEVEKKYFNETVNEYVNVFARLNVGSLEFSKKVADYLKEQDEQFIVIDLDVNPTFADIFKHKLNNLMNLDNLKEAWDVEPTRLEYNILYVQGSTNVGAWCDILCYDWNRVFQEWKQKGVLDNVKIVVLMSLENNFSSLFNAFLKKGKSIVFVNNEKATIRELLLKLKAVDWFKKITVVTDTDAMKKALNQIPKLSVTDTVGLRGFTCG
jgi:hypothetical protein